MKGRTNPWFSPQLSSLLKENDVAWAKVRKSKSQTNWLIFRQLRSRFTSLIKKAKSEFYISRTTMNLKDPKKFWKVIKTSYGNVTTNELPAYIVKGSCTLTNKSHIPNCFNEQFRFLRLLIWFFTSRSKTAKGVEYLPFTNSN